MQSEKLTHIYLNAPAWNPEAGPSEEGAFGAALLSSDFDRSSLPPTPENGAIGTHGLKPLMITKSGFYVGLCDLSVVFMADRVP